VQQSLSRAAHIRRPVPAAAALAKGVLGHCIVEFVVLCRCAVALEYLTDINLFTKL